MDERHRSVRIAEVFESLQGEGLLAGTPSTFVRVSGCNLRCTWCDSASTSWNPEGSRQTVDELAQRCTAGPRHVVLTGGEPMLFPAVAQLSHRLADRGHHVTVETAGTTWLEGMVCDLLSLSPKLAHSTPWGRAPALAHRHEARRLNVPLLRRLLSVFPGWQLKFVVRAEPDALETDLAEIEHLLRQLGVKSRDRDRVLLMPECTDPARLHEAYRSLQPLLREKGFRLGLRLHLSLYGHTPGT